MSTLAAAAAAADGWKTMSKLETIEPSILFVDLEFFSLPSIVTENF